MTFPRFLYSFYEASLTRKLEKEELRRHLYSLGLTDIDLVIITSGESRLSGFLLWQSAYSGFVFKDVYWSVFRKINFLRCLRDYGQEKGGSDKRLKTI